MKQLISDNVNLSDEVIFKLWVKELQSQLSINTTEPALLNGWANKSGRTTKYYKFLGRVYLEGELITGSGVAFTLPEGFRPDELLVFTNITIATNGDLTPSVATSLDGISFRI